MADNLISFTINDESLLKFGQKFRAGKQKRVKQALGEIKREWQAEFLRQDRRLQKVWTPLKTWVDGKARRMGNLQGGNDPQSYAERKKRQYFSGKGKTNPVRYLRILKRTGRMLDGYVSGIRIDDVNYSVTIPYPTSLDDDTLNTRAKVHQGILQRPKGMLGPRKWDLQGFRSVAEREIKRALARE